MPGMELTHFQFDVTDGLAVVAMDKAGEPVNTIGPAIFVDFATILDRLESDDDIHAVVWTSAKKDFLVGADIGWFASLTDPGETEDMVAEARHLLDRLENLHLEHGKPVVAAIDGACLGGGLEMAMLASMRIATNSKRTQLGQPETRLGVLPAGGATQRLPGLVGIAAALDLILTGRPARPRRALKIGLVAEVVPKEVLLDVAKKRATEAIGAPLSGSASVKEFLAPSHLQSLALEQNPMGRRVLFKKAEEKMLAETKGNYPAQERALEAIRIGVEEGREAGFAAEARFFAELVITPESKALQSIFFATQMMKHFTGTAAPPRHVSKVGILGGGLMGAGIATTSTLQAGSTVRLKEVDEAGVRRGLAHVERQVTGRVKRRRLRPFEGEQATNRVTGTTDWSGFGNVDLVIEAVFEDLELKQSLLQEVEGVTGPYVVFASNTSSIPIADIARASSRPETVLGMHYFSPVEKMPLLEVIKTDDTADWAISTAVAYGKSQGKTVIVVNDGTGFYTTRIVWPYGNEAMFLLGDGASVEAVDGAMEEWGFSVGPIRLGDEVGLDVGAKIAKVMVDAFGVRMEGPQWRQQLAEDNRLGRKNRRGFYNYDDKGKRGGVDDTVYSAVGLGPRQEIPKAEIQERIALAMVNEAAFCLQEGIITSAMDGDIAAVMGLGFPPFRGGPFWWVDQVGAGTVVEKLGSLAARHGERFAAADILRDHAQSGANFR